jgi:hypothetical protein
VRWDQQKQEATAQRAAASQNILDLRRCYCNDRGPECCKTQQRSRLPAMLAQELDTDLRVGGRAGDTSAHEGLRDFAQHVTDASDLVL